MIRKWLAVLIMAVFIPLLGIFALEALNQLLNAFFFNKFVLS
jgi:hypothetical protein